MCTVLARRRRIVLGVTGSNAAVKAQSIALALRHHSFHVRVAMTRSAKKVIGEAALSSVVRAGIYSDMWEFPEGFGEPHVEWADWADAMVIAPATASSISSLWQGSYDSAVTLIAANVAPSALFLAPAMSQSMWEQPAVKRNVETLSSWGVRFLGPEYGKVATGALGQRLLGPREITGELNRLVRPKEDLI